jgi:pimeloyl-ACP methyl ester carboxylesterase
MTPSGTDIPDRRRVTASFMARATVGFVRTVPHISYARSADGVSLAFTVAGTGPALVFVPWVPFSNLRMEWQNPLLHGVFERLSRRLTLIHYDGRGTGHSQRDVADLSLDAMISDLEAVVDQAGVAEVSLLGQYNSCPHAIAYAARQPRRVRRMACSAAPRAAGTR